MFCLNPLSYINGDCLNCFLQHKGMFCVNSSIASITADQIDFFLAQRQQVDLTDENAHLKILIQGLILSRGSQDIDKILSEFRMV